jgi:hypothetical protein
MIEMLLNYSPQEDDFFSLAQKIVFTCIKEMFCLAGLPAAYSREEVNMFGLARLRASCSGT